MRQLLLKVDAYLSRRLGITIRPVLRRVRALRRSPFDSKALEPSVMSAGRRAMIERIEGTGSAVKIFSDDRAGRAALAAERRAHDVFGGAEWKLPILEWIPGGFSMPEFGSDARLDRAVEGLTAEQRVNIAARALSIALDINAAGYAHRDFHPGNLFWVDGQLHLGDFETLIQLPQRTPFLQSYDLTGRGLPSPHSTNNMCYVGSEGSLEQVLRVPLDIAIERLAGDLKEELHQVSLTFKRREIVGRTSSRHRCKSERTYASFRLPGLEVAPSDAQRDTQKRFEQFGLGEASLRDMRVLDLGSNIGAMSLGAAQRGASWVLGMEYDPDKVRVASRVAAFTGFTNVQFAEQDVDKVEPLKIADTADVVFCLAIEAHVQDRAHLFDVLGAACTSTLYFEGNVGCSISKTERALRNAGFRSVEYLGHCLDDAVSSNNARPVWIAKSGDRMNQGFGLERDFCSCPRGDSRKSRPGMVAKWDWSFELGDEMRTSAGTKTCCLERRRVLRIVVPAPARHDPVVRSPRLPSGNGPLGIVRQLALESSV